MERATWGWEIVFPKEPRLDLTYKMSLAPRFRVWLDAIVGFLLAGRGECILCANRWGQTGIWWPVPKLTPSSSWTHSQSPFLASVASRCGYETDQILGNGIWVRVCMWLPSLAHKQCPRVLLCMLSPLLAPCNDQPGELESQVKPNIA